MLAVALGIGGWVVGADETGSRPQLLLTLALLGLLSVAYPIAGALIVSRAPRNVVGWLLIWAGFAMSVVSFAGAYGRAGPQDSSGTQIAAWLASWVFVPALALSAVLLLLLFPTGSPPSPRWRPFVLSVVVMAIATAVGYAFRPGELALGGSVENPFGFAAGSAALALLARLGDVLFPVVLLAALGSMIVRYRDAGAEEREQLKWFAYAAAIMVVGVGVASLPLPSLALVGWVVAAVGLAALPVTVAIAIFKYRLYDIDLIISETLIYVSLIAILGGLFTGSIAFFQRVFIAVTGDTSDAAVVLTALIVAGALTPIRKALEGSVERRFKPTSSDEDGNAVLDTRHTSVADRLDDIEARVGALERTRRQVKATRSRRS